MFLQLASLLLTFGVGFNNIQPVDPGQYFSTDFTVENHVLVSVNDKAAKEIRIYKDSGITTIDEHAFDGCSFDSVMISDCVTTINAEISENVLVKFTKAKSSYSFDLPENVQYLEHSLIIGQKILGMISMEAYAMFQLIIIDMLKNFIQI